MASFQSTITERGMEELTRLLVTGGELLLSQAVIGDGRAEKPQNRMTEVAHPIAAEVHIGDKSFIESVPSYLLIPVYISNAGLEQEIYIREVMLYGMDEEEETLFPFAYAWLDGADTDNILPATKAEDGASDTVHIHEIALLATDQMNALVEIAVSGGNWVTAAQMEAYALKKPQVDGFSGDFLQKTETGVAWADLGEILEDLQYLTDDETGVRYRLGISDGALYCEEE